jgi:hypothetical protein
MWARAAGISDHDLVNFDLKKDLVEVRAGPTAYGVIILGKIRLPAVNDDLGEGFVHVRIHDPPDRVSQRTNLAHFYLVLISSIGCRRCCLSLLVY